MLPASPSADARGSVHRRLSNPHPFLECPADLRLYRQWENHGGSSLRLLTLLLLSSSALWAAATFVSVRIVAYLAAPSLVLAALQTVRGSGDVVHCMHAHVPACLLLPAAACPRPHACLRLPPACWPPPLARLQLLRTDRLCARILESPGIEEPLTRLNELLFGLQ